MRKVYLDMDREKAYPCIADENFEACMMESVEPFLDGFRQDGWYEREEGKPLYYENYILPSSKKSMIVSHGFTESSEKYKEVIYYFLQEGYSVFLVNHRGHGKSVREAGTEDYSLTHVEKFNDYIEDFRGFIEDIVVPASPDNSQFYLYAHSMGGAIAARYLQLYPGRISKAVLTSPMLEIKTYMPHKLAKFISWFMVRTGRGRSYIIGQKAFSGKETFEKSVCSGKERFQYYQKKRIENQELQNNAGSYNWLYESIRMTEEIAKETRQIQIPLCIFTVENDTLVNRKGQMDLAEKTPDSRLVFIPESKHEVFMGPARIQRQYWRYVFGFFSK